jgi:hypothetical protein
VVAGDKTVGYLLLVFSKFFCVSETPKGTEVTAKKTFSQDARPGRLVGGIGWMILTQMSSQLTAPGQYATQSSILQPRTPKEGYCSCGIISVVPLCGVVSAVAEAMRARTESNIVKAFEGALVNFPCQPKALGVGLVKALGVRIIVLRVARRAFGRL